MFPTLRIKIHRLPWWGQAVAWPGYWLLSMIAWLLREMGVQALSGTKKAVTPLLWPIAALVLLFLTVATMGEDEALAIFGSLLSLIIVVGGAALGFGIMWRSTFSAPKKHRKKRKRR